MPDPVRARLGAGNPRTRRRRRRRRALMTLCHERHKAAPPGSTLGDGWLLTLRPLAERPNSAAAAADRAEGHRSGPDVTWPSHVASAAGPATRRFQCRASLARHHIINITLSHVCLQCLRRSVMPAGAPRGAQRALRGRSDVGRRVAGGAS